MSIIPPAAAQCFSAKKSSRRCALIGDDHLQWRLTCAASLIHKAAAVIAPIIPTRLSKQECGGAIWLPTTSPSYYTPRTNSALCALLPPISPACSNTIYSSTLASLTVYLPSDSSSSTSTPTSTTTWYLCWQSWNQKVSAFCLPCHFICRRMCRQTCGDCFLHNRAQWRCLCGCDSCGHRWQCSPQMMWLSEYGSL